jgi:hypothetical protein
MPTLHFNNAGSHQFFVLRYAEKPTPHVNNAGSHQLSVSRYAEKQLLTPLISHKLRFTLFVFLIA